MVIETMTKRVENLSVPLCVDEILVKVGAFGRFQLTIDVIVALSYLYVGYEQFTMYFMSLNSDWKCRQNSKICKFNGTLSSDDERRCHIPRDQWQYTEDKDFSLVTSFDIHCDKKYLLSLGFSMIYVGWAFGAVILGYLSDKYGRKTVLLPSALALLSTGLITAWLPNVYYVILSRFIVGFFIPGILIQTNILISDIVSMKYRSLSLMIPFCIFPIAYSTVAVKAYFLQNWKLLCIVCTAPYFLILFSYPFFPESVKWLQINNRNDDAIKVLRRIGKWNGNKLDKRYVLESSQTSLNEVENIKSGERTRLILSTFRQSFIWLSVGISFYGLQVAAKELQGPLYRNFILLGLVQFPAIIISYVSCNKLGRKKSTLISILLAGLACISIACVPSNHKFATVRVSLGIIGKFSASFTYQCLYLWSVELFPTHFKSKGMGFTQVASRVGASSAPWIVKGLSAFSLSLPFVVLGAPAIIAAVIGMWLPETNFEPENRKDVMVNGTDNKGNESD